MTHSSPPDELLKAVEHGDRAATTRFVDEYLPTVLRLLRAGFWLLSREDCEEIAVDAILDVIAGLPKYDRSKPFAPWYMTIVRRRALDFLRDHKDEWIERDGGKMPAHVSFDELRGGSGELPQQAEASTARDLESSCVGASESDDLEVQESGLADKLSQVHAWVDTLNERDRVVLDHYKYGSSWDTVVEDLAKLGHKTTVGAVRVRGHRLIKQAQQALGLEIEE